MSGRASEATVRIEFDIKVKEGKRESGASFDRYIFKQNIIHHWDRQAFIFGENENELFLFGPISTSSADWWVLSRLILE